MNSKANINNLVKVILFLAIIYTVFLSCTYLFRNTGRTKRENILDYYEEEQNSLDVVFVGASNILRYWDPMRAWNEYGFTSRNYATLAMGGSTYLYALQDALRTQNPKLVVIEPRMFLNDGADKNVGGVRNFLDSLDYDFFRLQAVNYYCENMEMTWEEAIPYYIDLVHYHDNYAALKEWRHWQLADNRVDKVTDYEQVIKGYHMVGKLVVYDKPAEDVMSEKRADLDSKSLKIYKDLIEYCQSENIDLLFLSSPWVVTESEMSKLNTLSDVAQSYGVPFINTNRLYDEMGLDFSQDLMDAEHTNILGGDKFTDYMAAYLTDNYDLPDHRGEEAYASWNELYEEYLTVAKRLRKKVKNQIAKNEKTFQTERDMIVCENAIEWLDMAKESKITLLMAANELPEGVPSDESLEVLGDVGITEEYFAGKGSLKVIYSRGIKYKDFSWKEKSGTIGSKNIKYMISLEEEPQILINKENYYDSSKTGIHIVAFNNNSGEIFDVIYLKIAEDGSLVMER